MHWRGSCEDSCRSGCKGRGTHSGRRSAKCAGSLELMHAATRGQDCTANSCCDRCAVSYKLLPTLEACKVQACAVDKLNQLQDCARQGQHHLLYVAYYALASAMLMLVQRFAFQHQYCAHGQLPSQSCRLPSPLTCMTARVVPNVYDATESIEAHALDCACHTSCILVAPPVSGVCPTMMPHALVRHRSG